MTFTHGLSKKHPLYERWSAMRGRCNNPDHKSYHRYGGRGIGICEQWADFMVFLADMEATWPGPGYDLHRVDNDAGYSPENCVWLSESEHMSIPKSAEHRAKIGAAHKGRKQSPEHAARNGLAHRAKLDPDWLRDAYEQRGLSVYAIAAETGVSKSSVHRAVRRLGLTKKAPKLEFPLESSEAA